MEQVQTTGNVNTIQTKKGTNPFKKFMRWLFFLLLLAIVGFVATGYLYSYSDGFREGYVYKFSKKGLLFKTHEGILKTGFVNLGNTATPNEEWEFSVVEDSVIKVLNAAGERKFLKLYYHQRVVKLFWRGDTEYFIYKAEALNEPNK
jgi:hypothetical protein